MEEVVRGVIEYLDPRAPNLGMAWPPTNGDVLDALAAVRLREGFEPRADDCDHDNTDEWAARRDEPASGWLLLNLALVVNATPAIADQTVWPMHVLAPHASLITNGSKTVEIRAAIDEASARSVLQLLRRIQQPLSEEAARALAREQGWTVDADLRGEGLVASGTWPGAAEAIMFTFADGQTRTFSVSAFCAPTEDAPTLATARKVFAMLVQVAEETYGQATGTQLGHDPRAWWVLSHQTVGLTQGSTFATIRWYTHEDHDNLLRSMRDETYEGMLDDEE